LEGAAAPLAHNLFKETFSLRNVKDTSTSA